MIRRTLGKFQIRELLLAQVTLVLAIGFPMVFRFILPAYDRWESARADLEVRTGEYTRLNSNLAVRKRVDEEFAKLAPDILQEDSDQITLSVLLRGMETALHQYPTLMMVNAKPLPVKATATAKTYRVNIAVGGKLQDVLQFVSSQTGAGAVVGLNSFSMRGMQGDNAVECTVDLQTTRLVTPKVGKKSTSQKVKEAAHG